MNVHEGVTELGYVGVEAADVPAWEHFARDLLGVDCEAMAGGLALRYDDRVHRLLVQPGPADDLAFLGFDCATDATLEAIAARLHALGVAVDDGGAALARERQVRRLLLARDPAGNRVELYLDLARGTPLRGSALVPSGFVTADGGAGHVFLPTLDRQPMLDFYGALGFRLSDYIVQELAPGMVVDAAFMHCNGRHHTIAFAAMPVPKKMHHFMLEAQAAEDVGRAYDRVLAAGVPLELTLGMHPNDHMLSFYVRTPSGFSIEFGSGGRVIEDDATWQVATYDCLSTWGHKPPVQFLASLSRGQQVAAAGGATQEGAR